MHSPSHHDLLDALELGSLVLGPVPELAWYLSIPGVIARETGVSQPFANLVAMARLDERSADDAIGQVVEHFARAGKTVGWMLGPRSTPVDLRARLLAAGFSPFKEQLALADTTLERVIPTSPDVQVRRATRADIDIVDHLKSVTFEMPTEAAHWIDRLIFGAAEQSGSVLLHLASIDGVPVAFAQTFLWRERGIAILGGAGTLPEARGRGVFRTLLAQRYADARAHGCSAATIQAYEDTSAPICKRLGFHELGRLTLFTKTSG